MQGIFRRGGVLWARLVVPERLRQAAGRREFIQSTRCHDLRAGRVVGAQLLAAWRLQLLHLEGRRLNDEHLRLLLSGSPALHGDGHVSLARASELTGIAVPDLLREAEAGRLDLACRIPPGYGAGYVIDRAKLDRDGEGFAISGSTPDDSYQVNSTGHVLRLFDGGRDIAQVGLIDPTAPLELVVFEYLPGQAFVPDKNVLCPAPALAVETRQIEAIRGRWAERVSSETVARLERTETARQAPILASVDAGQGRGDSWAEKPYSEALAAYMTDPDGLRGRVSVAKEIRQAGRTLERFVELHGDLQLGQIKDDHLRAYREWFRTWPAGVLPKRLVRPTWTETIEVASSEGWPTMSQPMIAERVVCVRALFRWLHQKGRIATEIGKALSGESGLTKVEKIKANRVQAAEAKKNKRKTFTPEVLTAFFSQPQFKIGNGLHVKGKRSGGRACDPAQYWAPLIALYAGTRLNEVCQLWLSDIRQEDGVWILDLIANSPDKSLKTEDTSYRQIPVHPTLIKLGLLQYCDALSAAGYRRLFPELTWEEGQYYSGETGRRFTEAMRSLGYARDGTLTFHSLRHTMNDTAMRMNEDGLREIARYEILGHGLPPEKQDVNKKSYTHPTIHDKFSVISSVEFEGMPEVTAFDIQWGLAAVKKALDRKLGNRRGCEDMGPAAGAV